MKPQSELLRTSPIPAENCVERQQRKAHHRMKDDDDDSDDEDEPESTGDLLQHDMGTGLPFRPATFDACISISALHWLCYSNSAKQNPRKRLTRFFSSLYAVLKAVPGCSFIPKPPNRPC